MSNDVGTSTASAIRRDHSVACTPDIGEFARDGFQLHRGVVSAIEIDNLIEAIESAEHIHGRHRGNAQFAIRRLTEAVPRVAELVNHPTVSHIVQEILGDRGRLVRSILFDKTADANWAVPPHQDTTIAVEARIDVPGFGPWSVKAGVPHVQPPREILESMVTFRLHLDDCPDDAGALRVIPGSQTLGILNTAEIAALAANAKFVTCPAAAGDCLVMRPMLIHASSPAVAPTHRRVVHLEFAACDLPNGLKWHGG